MKKLITVGLMGLLLAGCSHAGTTSTATPAPQTTGTVVEQEETTTPPAGNAATGETVVEIKGFAFSPKDITVAPGATITITNKDLPAHTLTSDDGKSFDSGTIGKDKTVTITAPTTPGSYPFHCTPHPNMKGTLIVK